MSEESPSALEDFWAGLSLRGKVVTVGVVFLLLGVLAGFFDALWAIVLILIGIIVLLVGVSVLKPKPPPVVTQTPTMAQPPPGAAYYPPPGGYYPPPAGYSAPSNPGPSTREVITREIVKIPCRNCGTLVDLTAVRCPNCSAPIR